MTGTWIVVADSTRARIFSPVRQRQALKQIYELYQPSSRAYERELTTDKPGRMFDSKGPGRHAMSESVSPKKHEAWKLCHQLSDDIETARAQGRFDRLVLVAAPALLGELRKLLSDQTVRLVVDELDKNLAQMDTHDIVKHIPLETLK